MSESDIGKHAGTACGSVRVIRQNDGIEGDERECLTMKQSVVDCFAKT
ncbi:hypothetical protein DSOL_3254 [Desulfosporosinus metallidurans]|uniref:Uncharacterized protein n=1 Tax=Desulfosporosinus metallidurans TaxID=1888891 RepID=A0A1Q8QS38_9FIRM|nr:hypothetical protein DSOL_3254 [Desulfosporosinus metallidurans]